MLLFFGGVVVVKLSWLLCKVRNVVNVYGMKCILIVDRVGLGGGFSFFFVLFLRCFCFVVEVRGMEEGG